MKSFNPATFQSVRCRRRRRCHHESIVSSRLKLDNFCSKWRLRIIRAVLPQENRLHAKFSFANRLLTDKVCTANDFLITNIHYNQLRRSGRPGRALAPGRVVSSMAFLTHFRQNKVVTHCYKLVTLSPIILFFSFFLSFFFIPEFHAKGCLHRCYIFWSNHY